MAAEEEVVQAGEATISPKKPSKKPAGPTPEALSSFKEQLRKKLNALDEKALAKTAKNFGVQTSKYKGMNPGLIKMNTVNSIVGSASRGLRKDGRTQKELLGLIVNA